jgi:hypothetical protein
MARENAHGSANAVHVNGYIRLIGGAGVPAKLKESWVHPSRNIALGTHEVYDLTSNAWTKAADLPTPRNHAAGGAIDNRIYIIGGRTESVFIPNAVNIDLVEEYNRKTDQWLLRAPMPSQCLCMGDSRRTDLRGWRRGPASGYLGRIHGS